MAWVDPRTWQVIVAGAKNLVDAADLNEQIRDNLRELKGLDGAALRYYVGLKDMDASPVGDIALRCINETLEIRNFANSAYKKLHISSIPTGTTATTVALGNHTH